jgi:hypothetical protein
MFRCFRHYFTGWSPICFLPFLVWYYIIGLLLLVLSCQLIYLCVSCKAECIVLTCSLPLLCSTANIVETLHITSLTISLCEGPFCALHKSYIYLLWSMVLLKETCGLSAGWEFSTFYETWRIFTVFTKAPFPKVDESSPHNPVSTFRPVNLTMHGI